MEAILLLFFIPIIFIAGHKYGVSRGSSSFIDQILQKESEKEKIARLNKKTVFNRYFLLILGPIVIYFFGRDFSIIEGGFLAPFNSTGSRSRWGQLFEHMGAVSYSDNLLFFPWFSIAAAVLGLIILGIAFEVLKSIKELTIKGREI